MKRKWMLWILVLATLVLAACSASTDPLSAPTPTQPDPVTTPSVSPVATPEPTSPVTTPSPSPQVTPAPVPPTPEAPPPVEDEIDAYLLALQADLESIIAEWGDISAVSVLDLQTGQTIAVNGSRPQLAACTIKFVILMALAQDIEAGRYTAEDVDPLVHSMMGPSNNPPAREIIGYLGEGDIGAGIDRINALMWDLGATDSIITHPPGYFWEEYGYLESHGTDENRVSADDMTTILGSLYRAEALSNWGRNYVLDHMTIAPDWMDQALRDPLPSDAQLFHKMGQLYEPESTWNDSGIVVVERDGQEFAYALSFLGSYAQSWQVAYSHAQTISGIIWDHFSANYELV